MASLDKIYNKMDHLAALTDHYQNILGLMGRSKDYDLLESI